jgi:hypothetical protein
VHRERRDADVGAYPTRTLDGSCQLAAKIPQTLTVPNVATLKMLADVRVLVEGHPPKQPRQKAGSVARAGKGIGRRSDAVDLKVLKEI